MDGPGLYPSLTARGNLAALAGLRGPGARMAGIDDVLDEVGLTDVADDKVRGFSLGMRQRLGLAAALLTKPRLLVLDEPYNGLDPAGKKHVHGVLTQLAADGATVVLSSHRSTIGPNAVPDYANPEQMNRYIWYQTHGWTKPYPGDSKIYAPNAVPGATLPSSESDG